MFLDMLMLSLSFGAMYGLIMLVNLVLKPNKITYGIFLILGIIVTFLFVYLVLPTKNLSGVVMFNVIGGLIAVGISYGIDSSIGESGNKINVLEGILLGLAFISIIVIQLVTGMTSVKEVYNTLDIKEVTKTEELVSVKETPIALSTKSAKNKINKMMNVVPNSNMFELGTITAQTIGGKYVYICSIEYKSFLNWKKLKTVPGYFMVSATDVNAQPEFIKKEMKYTPSSYLGDDASRKIYASCPKYNNVGKVNLETDDDGTPYYVQTMEKEYGISGKSYFNKYKVAVLNAITGEVNVYELKDAPKFLNAPLTSAVAQEMNDYFGNFGEGWWNQSIFGSNKGVKKPTENGIYSSGAVTPLVNKKGELLYFTDFTSKDSSQDSALGYSLINARTGELEYYSAKNGMMDSDGAIGVTEKIYPEKEWESKMPILYNVDGVPTWVISLLDSNGIFKRYVYLSAVDSDLMADGTDAQTTLDAYRKRLATKGSSNENSEKLGTKEVTGKVIRVSKTIVDNQDTINFMLENDDKVYTISPTNNIYVIFIKEGDEVSFTMEEIKNQKNVILEDITVKDLTPKVTKEEE